MGFSVPLRSRLRSTPFYFAFEFTAQYYFVNHPKKSVCHAARDFRGRDDLSCVALRVFGDVKQQADDIGRQAFTPDITIIEQCCFVGCFDNCDGFVNLFVRKLRKHRAVVFIRFAFNGEGGELRFGKLLAARVSQQPIYASRDVAQVKSGGRRAVRRRPNLTRG